MRALVVSLAALLAVSASAEPASPQKPDQDKLRVIVMLTGEKPDIDLEVGHKHFLDKLKEIKAIAKSQGLEDKVSVTYRVQSIPDVGGMASLCDNGNANINPILAAKGNDKPKDTKPKGPEFSFGGTIVITVSSEEQGLKLVKLLADKSPMVMFSGGEIE